MLKRGLNLKEVYSSLQHGWSCCSFPSAHCSPTPRYKRPLVERITYDAEGKEDCRKLIQPTQGMANSTAMNGEECI